MPPDGSVRKLTDGRDAGHPQLSPDLRHGGVPLRRTRQRDLWLVRTDGTGLRRLTDTPTDEDWPTFSPDGTEIAFTSNRDGAREIYRQPIVGGPAERVTNEPVGDAVEPAWNPHDGRIAYTLAGAGGDQPAGEGVRHAAAWR